MGPDVVLPAGLVGLGLGLTVSGVLLRGRRRDERLADVLDLPYGEQDVDVASVTERSGGVFESPIFDVAERAVTRFDARGSIAQALERAQIPMRPGEYALLTLIAAAAAASLLLALTQRWLFAPVGVVAAVFLAATIPSFRVGRRRRAFEEQLPEALTLIASSLQAGHTFLRAIQMMVEESDAPLSEEFGRVVQETRLGDSVVDALDRLAQRLDVRDVAWMVQAIRIQTSVGGKLADLLNTLADFMRAREEVRREVRILTAEGRASAWVLGALPLIILLFIQVVQPGYMAPLYQGWGLVWLGGTAASVAFGVLVILRLVKIEV